MGNLRRSAVVLLTAAVLGALSSTTTLAGSSTLVFTSVTDIAAGDIDNDGDIDIVLSHTRQAWISSAW